MRPRPDEIIALLGLEPHATCGFVAESYRSAVQVPPSVLPPGYSGSRALGGTLYFLVTPEAPVRLHRIRSDQMYHHYLGEPLEVLLLHLDGRSEVRVAGAELTSGARPQLLVPGGTFHAASVPDGGYALLGTSVWARAEPDDVELGDRERLMAAFPAARAWIAEHAR
jgi:predicted cupin superfamily sugar epimerase